MIHAVGNAQGLVQCEFIPEGHTVKKSLSKSSIASGMQ
jgi:hypothetical protein